jgi:hypothetical protein
MRRIMPGEESEASADGQRSAGGLLARSGSTSAVRQR